MAFGISLKRVAVVGGGAALGYFVASEVVGDPVKGTNSKNESPMLPMERTFEPNGDLMYKVAFWGIVAGTAIGVGYLFRKGLS